MKLYTVTICGHKYYFSGNLTHKTIQLIERFCSQIALKEKLTNPHTIFELLLCYVESDLGCHVTPVQVAHIFRVNL